jgi:pyruvate kinase
MNLFWGVRPVRQNHALSAEDMVSIAEKELLAGNQVKMGDVLGVVAGTQMASGSTNFLRLHVITGSETALPRSKGRRVHQKR